MRILAGLLFLIVCRGESLTGRIIIVKRLTKKTLTVPVYQTRGPVVNEGTFDADAELKRVVLFLSGDGLPAARPVHISVAQRNQRFEPYLVVIPAGSTVTFPNADPIFHNVFSLSKAKSFDLGYFPQGQSRSIRFENPGIVEVFCHIHPNMSAGIVVSPSAAYAQPDEHGEFAIPDLKPGTYDLIVWHKTAGAFHRRVTLSSTSAPIEVVIPVRRIEP